MFPTGKVRPWDNIKIRTVEIEPKTMVVLTEAHVPISNTVGHIEIQRSFQIILTSSVARLRTFLELRKISFLACMLPL